MFFLIPFAAAAVAATTTAISTSAIIGGAAASTAVAVGLKKYADYVEEENEREVSSVRKNSTKIINKCAKNARKNLDTYKSDVLVSLEKNISSSNMTPDDKKKCLDALSRSVIKGGK